MSDEVPTEPDALATLRWVEDVIAREGESPERLETRLQCLCDLGRFESAAELARAIAAVYPERRAAAASLEWLDAALAAPPIGTTSPRQRSYASAVPREVLLRIQQALHHYRYRGLQLVKNPFDLALYVLLFERLRPATVIEVGSKAGGSALWFADLLLSLGIDARVHSYDVFPVTAVTHPRVTFHRGDGRRLEEAADEAFMAMCRRPLLVIEDADHSYETTSAVLRFCHRWLRPGEYAVVEDGNLSDLYPEAFPDRCSGPHRALREFFAAHDGEYEIDAALCDFFGYNVTSCSNGFIRRIAAGAERSGAPAADAPGAVPTAARVERLRTRPWAALRAPADVRLVPTMLSEQEQALLYWLARDHFRGQGRIVDGGCFLGGSTAALAAGMRDRRLPVHERPIVSYDLFRVEPYTIETFGGYFPSSTVGSSFRAAFDRHLAQFGGIEVREGDICAIGWSGEPIEILFLDIVKTAQVNDVVLAQFFPRLIPGHSVIVQQDYLWGWGPWIHITMERLADYVERLDAMWNGSVLYLLTAPIPAELLRVRVAELSPDTQLALMDRAVARWSGEQRAMVELARVMLLVDLFGPATALDEFRVVRARMAASPRVQSCATAVAGFMAW